MKKSKKNILLRTSALLSVGTILALGTITSIQSTNNDEGNLRNSLISNLENDPEEKSGTKATFSGTVLDKNAITTLGWQSKTEITLADWANAPSVVELGRENVPADGPFASNISLRKITIPKRIKKINNASFFNSSSLQTVIFEENSELNFIGQSAFNSSRITTISIPDSVTQIASQSLRNTAFLREINFGANSKLKSIGDNAFLSSAITAIDVPDSVDTIGNNAFSRTSSLRGNRIRMPLKFKGRNTYGFTQEQWISINWKVPQYQGEILTQQAVKDLDWNNKSVILLDDWQRDAPNVTKIGNENDAKGAGAFSNVSALQSIQIPDKITSIGSFAFENTKSLSTITISDASKITSIGARAFLNSGIVSINISDLVSTIGEAAFEGTKSLNGNQISMKMKLKASSVKALYGFSQDQWDTISWRIVPFNGPTLTKEAVVSLGWDTEERISLVDWRQYAPNVTKIGTNSETSGQGLFSNNAVLKTIEIPEKVTSIGNYVFENSSITSIYVPNAVTTIGTHTFSGTKALLGEQVSMTLRLKNSSAEPLYGFDATQWNAIVWRVNQFSGDTLTKEVVVSLGWDIEKTITLDKWKRLAPNVTKIGTNVRVGNNGPFSDNKILELIEVPNSITFVSDNAFSGTSSLTSIQFSYRSRIFNAENSSIPLFGLTDVQWEAINWIEIPERNIIINSIVARHLLKDDSVITWEEIAGYTGIQTEAFKGTNITSITIRHKANFTIGDNAFAGTTDLTNIQISDNFKENITNFGFSQNQIDVIKYISLPESNAGVIAGSISGVILAVAAGVGGFYLFKYLKRRQRLAYENVASDDVNEKSLSYGEDAQYNEPEEEYSDYQGEYIETVDDYQENNNYEEEYDYDNQDEYIDDDEEYGSDGYR